MQRRDYLRATAALALLLSFGAGCAKTGSAADPGQGASPASGSYGQGNGGSPGGGPGGPGGASGGSGAAGQGSGRRQVQVTVQGIQAVAGRLTASRNSAGVVTATVTSQVAALTSGIVQAVPRKAGDWVKAGEGIVALDDSQLRIALANAQAALDSAKVNLQTVQDSTSQNNQKLALQVQSAQATRDSSKKFYDSQKALYDLGGISASTLDTAGANLASAEAALETAKIALDQNQRGVATTASQNVDALKIAVTTAQNNLRQAELNLRNAVIRAPFDGQIAAMNVSPGMYVGLNTAAFVLVSQDRQVNFSISPQDAVTLGPGTALSFSVLGRDLPLTVRQAASAPVNGVVPLVASGNGLSGIPYGIVGDVGYSVLLATGILVPLSSVDTTDNRNYVYVVQNGKVGIQEVKVVAESGAVAAVTGVEAGATVVVSPPPGLVAGASVQVIPAQGITLGGGGPGAGGPGAGRQGAGAPGQASGTTGAATGGTGSRRSGSWTGGAGSGGAGSGGGAWSGQRSGQGGATTGTSTTTGSSTTKGTSTTTSQASGTTTP